MAIYNGTQKIKVSGVAKVYVGTQLVFTKEEPIVLTSITLSGQTTSLNRGATFSFGGTVTAHYSNGSTANVTSSTTFSGYNMSKAGTYTVTASYTEGGVTKTATYTLTVNKAWSAVWSGTKKLEWKANTLPPDPVHITDLNLTGNQTFRITWKYSLSGTSTKSFYLNGSNQSSQPSSPAQLSAFNTSSASNQRLGVLAGTSNNPNKRIVVSWNPHSSSTMPGFRLVADYVTSLGSSYALTLTITKIERYY